MVMRHRPDGTAHRAMAWAARRAQAGAGAEVGRGACGVAAVIRVGQGELSQRAECASMGLAQEA
ncbi:hypothetical protein GCM10010320_81700 [Streptomyces caelestis]|nr:hypothetical protein GCM10010320_81700 [Streptomyces caelestis]